jgi:hypothetical protein
MCLKGRSQYVIQKLSLYLRCIHFLIVELISVVHRFWLSCWLNYLPVGTPTYMYQFSASGSVLVQLLRYKIGWEPKVRLFL